MQIKLDTSLNIVILISIIGSIWYSAQMLQKLKDDAVTETTIREMIDNANAEKFNIVHTRIMEDIQNIQKAVDKLAAERALPREKKLLEDWKKGK